MGLEHPNPRAAVHSRRVPPGRGLPRPELPAFLWQKDKRASQGGLSLPTSLRLSPSFPKGEEKEMTSKKLCRRAWKGYFLWSVILYKAWKTLKRWEGVKEEGRGSLGFQNLGASGQRSAAWPCSRWQQGHPGEFSGP